MDPKLLESITESVLKKSSLSKKTIDGDVKQTIGNNSITLDGKEIVGYDFSDGIHYDHIFRSYLTTGFQATNFALAIEQIQAMNLVKNYLMMMIMKKMFSLREDLDVRFF
ncbi:hypothetical protein SSS_08071 [Sarcoptes scabiei]|nr:hypothetical protein SSS_08071 [Sarcoptes scabiei]